MLKKLATLGFVLLAVTATYGQQGSYGISILGEAGAAFRESAGGGGLLLKAKYGITRAGSVTLSAGYARFREGRGLNATPGSLRLVPLLVGYQQHVGRFFVEPQLGIGELGGRIETRGDYARPSVAAAMFAANAGYAPGRWYLGVRVQAAHGIEGASAGLWHDRNFRYGSVFFGYNLFKTQHR